MTEGIKKASNCNLLGFSPFRSYSRLCSPRSILRLSPRDYSEFTQANRSSYHLRISLACYEDRNGSPNLEVCEVDRHDQVLKHVSQSPIKVIFFDAAGTLFHVKGSVADVYLHYAKKYGVKNTPELIAEVNSAFSSCLSSGSLLQFLRFLTLKN